MKINSVELSISAVRQSQYPTDNKPEFLLVGRSNVGKSSFINSIIERRNYARTSSKPGKTQTLNFYNVNNDFYLVDVPGYGYASVSKERQQKFGMMIEEYLTNRENLKEVFLLIDFRHKPTNDDLLMYNFLKYYDLSVTIILTKVDKIGRTLREKQLQLIKDTLNIKEEDKYILFSSTTKLGKNDVTSIIDKIVYPNED
ncbi:probable GTP-binding protein EngB [Clostridium sp. CAG:433]|jgi:ribosome biogenesis GTP-binding protein ysxC|nr:YihA family ribosome biogenesis GTP-binding protein [Bacilli bacterium]CDD29301.1 probable GTP-binding protein EngB [Clostridium sp. CAG:433]HCJ32380.1 YihA family ribosome biogenesis GTP-binding protein [Bacillota bacterium]